VPPARPFRMTGFATRVAPRITIESPPDRALQVCSVAPSPNGMQGLQCCNAEKPTPPKSQAGESDCRIFPAFPRRASELANASASWQHQSGVAILAPEWNLCWLDGLRRRD